MSTPRTFPPSVIDPFLAADWLLARHEWVRHLIQRIALPGQDRPHWLDQLAEAYADLAAHAADWKRYEATHRPPGSFASDAEWDAWEAAGPELTDAARALAVMSAGEQRMCRLVATLHPDSRDVGWHVDDLQLDGRGVAFFLDWIRVALTALAWDERARAALTTLTTMTTAMEATR